MALALFIIVFFGAIIWWISWQKQDEDHEAEIKTYKVWLEQLKGDLAKSEGRYRALEQGYDEMQEGLEQVILDHQDTINTLMTRNAHLSAEMEFQKEEFKEEMQKLHKQITTLHSHITELDRVPELLRERIKSLERVIRLKKNTG